MRKLFVLVFAATLAIGAMAQRRNATAEDWHYFQQKGCTLKLERYGLYQNGTEQNKIYPQGKNLNEYCILRTSTMLHKNTLDGDYMYDFKIDGQYLRLSTRVYLKEEGGVKGFDPDYDNWIRLVWVEQKGDKTILFTYDKYGTYRYFTTSNPEQKLPNSLCGFFLNESYSQVIASLKSQKINYEITKDNYIQCLEGVFTFNQITFNYLYIYFDNNNKVKGIMLGFAEVYDLDDIFFTMPDEYEKKYAQLETVVNQKYSKYHDPERVINIKKGYTNDATIKAYSDKNANILLYITKDMEVDEAEGYVGGFAEVMIMRYK